jgi:hypothetical protein
VPASGSPGGIQPPFRHTHPATGAGVAQATGTTTGWFVRFGHGEGPGPVYVTHQFSWRALRSPLAGAIDSSRTSAPMVVP